MRNPHFIQMFLLVFALACLGATPTSCLPTTPTPSPSPWAGAWQTTLTGSLQTSIDDVVQPGETWSPAVSIQFNVDGDLLAASSLAPDMYYRVADGSRQAQLQAIGDEDVSCVYSRAASGYEHIELTSYESDDSSVSIELTSEFSGHSGSTTMSDGQASQTIEIQQQADGLLCTLTYSGKYDLRELEGPDGEFVTRHYIETFTASATLISADVADFTAYEDSCPQ